MKKLLALVSAVLMAATILASPSPAIADINPYLDNTFTFYNDMFYKAGLQGGPWGNIYPNRQTMSNQPNLIIARGYGMCVRYGARLDVFPVPENNTFVSVQNAFALIQVDDGNCTGPLINVPITIETAPLMPRPHYGTPTIYTFGPNQGWINWPWPTSALRDCPAIAGGTGVVSVARNSSFGGCSPDIEQRVGAGALGFPYYYYSHRGDWSTFTVVKVNGATFMHRPPERFLIPSY